MFSNVYSNWTCLFSIIFFFGVIDIMSTCQNKIMRNNNSNSLQYLCTAIVFKLRFYFNKIWVRVNICCEVCLSFYWFQLFPIFFWLFLGDCVILLLFLKNFGGLFAFNFLYILPNFSKFDRFKIVLMIILKTNASLSMNYNLIFILHRYFTV